MRAELGCDAPTTPPWNERAPGVFDVAIDRCPMYYLKRWDPWRDAVLRLHNDYEAGVVRGWPDDYNNQAVEAVHMLRAELKDCEARLMNA